MDQNDCNQKTKQTAGTEVASRRTRKPGTSCRVYSARVDVPCSKHVELTNRIDFSHVFVKNISKH